MYTVQCTLYRFLQLDVQWNYRIQALRKVAACSGVHGARVKIDSTYNIFINNQGAANTNKAGDLEVSTLYK